MKGRVLLTLPEFIFLIKLWRKPIPRNELSEDDLIVCTTLKEDYEYVILRRPPAKSKLKKKTHYYISDKGKAAVWVTIRENVGAILGIAGAIGGIVGAFFAAATFFSR